MAEYHELDDLNGNELGWRFICFINSDDKWSHGKCYMFTLGKDERIKLEAFPKNQPGNGCVSFHAWGKWYTTPHHKLQTEGIFEKGFGEKYKQFENAQFKDLDICYPGPDWYFQAFVLLQFEIARRKSGDPEGFPNSGEVKKAIDNALDLDSKEGYDKLFEVFSGEKKLLACNELEKWQGNANP